MTVELNSKISSNCFKSEQWKKTNYYEFDSNREGASCIYLIEIKKIEKVSLEESLSYLLQRYCFEFENWGENQKWELTEEQFFSFILSEGYLNKPKGEQMPIAEFWKIYKDLLLAIRSKPQSVFLKNGHITKTVDILTKNQILSVFCFDTRWNNKQFLIETDKQIFYFDWGTSA